MREIKFRAYIKKDYDEKLVGKMLEVSSIHLKKKKVIIGYSLSKSYYGNRSFLYENIELMQFTGLHDKNGKEIYEGDIVDVTRPYIYETGTIIFKNGCFFIKVKETLLALWECEPNNYELEVIGNIYENSNLLKGADNIL